MGLGELKRIAVRDAARNERQPVAVFDARVQLADLIPELGLAYVQDVGSGARYAVDRDTSRQDELLPGRTYPATVNAEGYVLRIGLPAD